MIFVTTVDVPPVGAAFAKVTTPVPLSDPVASVIVSGLGEMETFALVPVAVPDNGTGVGVTVSPVEVTVREPFEVPAVAGA